MLLHFNDLVIKKHCKFYGIVVIMFSGNLLEIIYAGLLDTLYQLLDYVDYMLDVDITSACVAMVRMIVGR